MTVVLFISLITLLIALGLALESGRAAKRIQLVVATMTMCLASSAGLVYVTLYAPPPPPPDFAAESASVQLDVGGGNGDVNLNVGEDRPRLISDCELCPLMVTVIGGMFHMGIASSDPDADPGESPLRPIQILPFALGHTEISRAEFAQFVSATGHRANRGCETPSGYDAQADWQSPGIEQGVGHPVVCISYDDAIAYTRWLSRISGRPYRLPSEAEWEYAARAEERSGRPERDAGVLRIVNVGRSRGGTVVGGIGEPNKFGLHDMIGNVSEYVADCWSPTIADLPHNGKPLTGPECRTGVARGANWRSPWRDIRFVKRALSAPSSATGFRVARSLKFMELPLAPTPRLTTKPAYTASR